MDCVFLFTLFALKPECSPQYWVSYGWCDQDIEKDRTMTHLVFFTFLTLIFGMTGMYMYYCPHRL